MSIEQDLMGAQGKNKSCQVVKTKIQENIHVDFQWEKWNDIKGNPLPVVVDVADDDGEQAEEEYDSGGVDDGVQGLDAGREKLHTAEVLRDRWGDQSSVLGDIVMARRYVS